MTNINFAQIAANGPNHQEINRLRRSAFTKEADIAKTIQEILKEEAQLEKKYCSTNTSEQARLNAFNNTDTLVDLMDEPNRRKRELDHFRKKDQAQKKLANAPYST